MKGSEPVKNEESEIKVELRSEEKSKGVNEILNKYLSSTGRNNIPDKCPSFGN